MCLVERSGFGLNALLGLIATHPKAALATHEALERTAHDQNHAPLEGQQRPLMQSRTQEAEIGKATSRERRGKEGKKTAYELRISDWSSDVCTSDLLTPKLSRPA